MIPITKTTKIVLAVVFTLLVIAALAVIVWHETKCKPKCANKHCGNDGCGGTCGSCDDGEYCDANKHKCVNEIFGQNSITQKNKKVDRARGKEDSNEYDRRH